jgi:ribosomal protein S27AE
LTDDNHCAGGTEHPGWVCDGCGKHVTDSIPADQCYDCGGRWFVATKDRLACDRCGEPGASRVLNSEFNRLCTDCVDWENRNNPECLDCGRNMVEVDPPETAEPQSWECPECWRHVDADDRSVYTDSDQDGGSK